ncbi:type III effector, partial [Pseudomonas syringae pv. tagetis]
MCNVCGTSGSNHVYSTPISPQHASGTSTPVPSAPGTMLSIGHE